MNKKFKSSGLKATSPAGYLSDVTILNEKPSVITTVKIRNFPITLDLYDPKMDLFPFNRTLTLFKKFPNFPKGEVFVLNDPFNADLVRNYIGPRMYSTSHITVTHSYALDNCWVQTLNPMSCYGELRDGVYAYFFEEGYLDQTSRIHGLIFDKSVKRWDENNIAEFLVSFAKELSLIRSTDYKKKDLKALNSVFLPESILKDITEDIDCFIHSRKLYKDDLELAWKRGYMLIGPPGNGKSLLIRKICSYFGLGYFDASDCIRQGNFDLGMNAGFSNLEDILFPEEVLPRVCVLEDIDKFTAFQSDADEKDYAAVSLHQLLKGLDGVDQHDGIILIATTNFPDLLHEAIVGRPGRFDKIYRLDLPTDENIKKFLLYHKMTIDMIDLIVQRLGGYSMAFVEEFVKSAKMKFKRNEITFVEANEILKAIEEHKKLCSKHFKEEKSLGFGR